MVTKAEFGGWRVDCPVANMLVGLTLACILESSRLTGKNRAGGLGGGVNQGEMVNTVAAYRTDKVMGR